EAAEVLGLSPHRKTVLVTGGSLGARTLNESMRAGLDKLVDAGVQLLWQCGEYYYDALRGVIAEHDKDRVKLMAFIHRMDLAYAMADVIVARAGAGTIAELCVVGKPVVLVPSPNVAEDHQTKN